MKNPKSLTKITTVILSKTAFRNLITKPVIPEFDQKPNISDFIRELIILNNILENCFMFSEYLNQLTEKRTPIKCLLM